ncbi:PspA/IM30 family protein [Bacillus sp. T3]|uniref:PspA/IM30 family protein n=1 Tax=Bacillus sp. T3 TaxID=467262 RepID=UPI0029817A5C|nr:PspA/IM30 family protein [Bacillus sp. T3]
MKRNIRGASTKKLALIARANVAEVTNQVNGSLASFSPESAVKGFARMEEQILNLEAKASASQSFYEMNLSKEAQYLNKALQDEVQIELEKLKQAKTTTV